MMFMSRLNRLWLGSSSNEAKSPPQKQDAPQKAASELVECIRQNSAHFIDMLNSSKHIETIKNQRSREA